MQKEKPNEYRDIGFCVQALKLLRHKQCITQKPNVENLMHIHIHRYYIFPPRSQTSEKEAELKDLTVDTNI